ncbi:uncharacterized protein LOC124431860 [Vespa crabro]|uniref:uncharacterized protein LOC124431860 n=1 Tax=Vespa crabro TaxID=7445 RepID=UPI001F019B57|nr:uncharacterized protein LOC124431860 [Vespa crabro]
MCNRSKWKPRSYCYSTKKIKSVPSTKWERQIPKDEDYWERYIRKEEKNLIVRDSYPNLTNFPSIHRYPQSLYRWIRNDDDANNVDYLTGNERKSFATNFPPCRLKSFTKENDLASISQPIVTVFPPTPSKRPTKIFSTRKEEYKRALAEDISFRKVYSSLFPVNPRNASNENEKIKIKSYLKKSRSFYENDRPTGTSRNGRKSSTSQTRGTLLNKNDLESIGKLVDKIELSDDFDFNRESFHFDDTDDRFDLQFRTTRNKDNDRIQFNSDLENKSECAISALTKHTERNKGASADGDFLKYSVRYAHEALKRVTKDLRSGNLGINEMTKKVRTMEDSEKYEKKFINISPISLKPLSSHDRIEEVEDYLPHTLSLTENFLNGLPKMSYFPRKKRDRCLSCLYKSLEEIGISSRKNAYDRRKEREEEGKYQRNISVEGESNGDVSLAEFKDEQNQCDFRVNEEVGFATERNSSDSNGDNIEEANKFGFPNIQGTGERRTSVNEVKETEGCLPVPELESTSPNDKRIAFKSMSSERSRGSTSNTDDDDDDSSVAYMEYSSRRSKYRPACHAPTIFSHSLEPLRALKLKKLTNMQARMTFNEINDESPTIIEANERSREIGLKKTGQTTIPMDTKGGIIEGDSKSMKKLIKIKSVSENLIIDAEVNEAKKKSLFRRSSSCKNFEWTLRDSTRGTSLPPPVLRSLAEDEPLFTKEEIEETLKNFEKRNASPTFALSTLCDMFLNRILESNDKRDRRRDNIAKRLVKLLVESRRYSNPDKFPSDLIFSSKQRPLLNGQRLRRILPLDSYNLIAPLLGIPEYYPRLHMAPHKMEKPVESTKERSDKLDLIQDTLDDLIVHPPSSRDSTVSCDEIGTARYNPYGLFMRKERRKAVIWRPLTEFDLKGYDPQATLRMRADKITTDICMEFCDWLRSLGGLERDIDERVLKDMFEINFSADACKTTQISVKEMATVPTDVALARLCHGTSVLATTRKQLERDAKAESRPKRTLAFGTSMPTDLLFIPPSNRVRETWLKCKNVPRELETMDVVWDGIIHLESVQAFVKCLRMHPKVSLPKMFKRAVLPKTVRKLAFVKENSRDI